MNSSTRRLLFCLFFLSGFSSLVYQVVWTRMAFASFGIISPVVSVVLSMFMLGLSIGSWAGGRWIGTWMKRTGLSAMWFYAGAELMIGFSAFAVPKLFRAGEQLLLSAGQMDSISYLSLSAVVLAFSILPWCICMGATFPFMMAFVREKDAGNTESFSFLYVANVLGAMTGAFLTAIALVELFGFQHTLWIAALGNFCITGGSGVLASSNARAVRPILSEAITGAESPQTSPRGRLVMSILFSTGFISLAMEVVWARAFTPVLRTQVYSFAMVVFAYLGATFAGSLLYRRDLRANAVRSTAQLISILSVAAFLPIMLNDFRLLRSLEASAPYLAAITLLISICPLCAVLGYLTPSLIDEGARGNPAAAGKAYAVNVLGCILGPLFASYLLLPWVGERYGLIVLAIPLLVLCLFTMKSLPTACRWATTLASGAALIWSVFGAADFAKVLSAVYPNTEIRRDYAASVISTGEGFNRQLMVNGVGMTALVPSTKFMAHLPLALHTGKPQSVLIICFGMGTTFRSALSWDVETTAVELVPSVRDAFGFYHADAAAVRANPKGRIIIDDGRRYLKRTRQKFDVIVIDPPPPVEAAGSSLLYSEEFYALAKQRLQPNGILQAWLPGGDEVTTQAVFGALQNAFPYLRCFRSDGGFGIHISASMEPIALLSAEQMAAVMRSRVADDLLEWSSNPNLEENLRPVFSREISLNIDPKIRMTDDHPYNEYFLLRRQGLIKPAAIDSRKTP